MNIAYTEKLVSLVSARLSRDELKQVLDLLESQLKWEAGKPIPDVFSMVKAQQHSTAFNSLALYLNRYSRELSEAGSAVKRAPLVRSLIFLREKLLAVFSTPAEVTEAPVIDVPKQGGYSIEDAVSRTYQITVGRTPVPEEIEIWKQNFNNGLPFHEFFLSMENAPEGQQLAQSQKLLPYSSDGEYVQIVYELVMGRGASAWEIEHWMRKLESTMTRAQVLISLFGTANYLQSEQANAVPHDGLSCSIMGTDKYLTATEWEHQARNLVNSESSVADNRYRNHFHIKGEAKVMVSALASMYCGGDFIEQFMDNITGQDGFDDYCELVIIDADSPENEYETIKRYLKGHRNINYIRCNTRIGIYDAWNMAAKASRGEFLTNTNMDDLRRHDSLLLQAATLENLPFVDVVYQDLYYTFDPRLSFDEIAVFGHETKLPVVTAHNMIQFNSPHNAPMWRKCLHDELGYFDTRYKSAGDYEFWMRCLAAGKRFYKINDPHVAYYQNPKGLSTRPDTRGIVEAMAIHKQYCRKLIHPDVVSPRDEFERYVGARSPVGANESGSRYEVVQYALRHTARSVKYAAQRGAQ